MDVLDYSSPSSGAGSSEADGHVMFVDASLPRG